MQIVKHTIELGIYVVKKSFQILPIISIYSFFFFAPRLYVLFSMIKSSLLKAVANSSLTCNPKTKNKCRGKQLKSAGTNHK